MGPRFSARPGRYTATNQGRRSRFTTCWHGDSQRSGLSPTGSPHRRVCRDCPGGDGRWSSAGQRRPAELVDGVYGGIQRRPRTQAALGFSRGRKSGTERAGRPIRKGASRRRRLRGILHGAGVTEMTSPAKSLTCGVLVSRSASGTGGRSTKYDWTCLSGRPLIWVTRRCGGR